MRFYPEHYRSLLSLGLPIMIGQLGMIVLGFADTMMVVRANQGLLNLWTTVGASGALYGILLAYGMYFPNERMFVIPFPQMM